MAIITAPKEYDAVEAKALRNDARILRAARSGDPDDAFAWWAIESEQLILEGFHFDVSSHHIQQNNELCVYGVYDLAAISSAAYPRFHEHYAILSPGASVGRGYGPALATRNLRSLSELDGATVAIPGELTTGALLLRLFHPRCNVVEYPFDRVAEAIACGYVDAGVLIHEELMNWENKGLRRMTCLGRDWMKMTGLPIPVGLNVVHRRLGEENIRAIARIIRESMVLALQNPKAAADAAMRDSIQTEDGIGQRFIEMFANDDTMELKSDCRKALQLLYEMSYARGLIDVVPTLEFIEG